MNFNGLNFKQGSGESKDIKKSFGGSFIRTVNVIHEFEGLDKPVWSNICKWCITFTMTSVGIYTLNHVFIIKNN